MPDPAAISRLISSESPLTAGQAARLRCPHRGQKTAPATVVRWIRQGCKGVYLEGYHDGTGWVTSREALARFYAALTAKKEGRPVAPSPEREEWLRKAREAGAELERLRRGGR